VDYHLEITEYYNQEWLYSFDTYNEYFTVQVVASNNPPGIAWENPPATVHAGQAFIVRARATDSNGNLTLISMELNGDAHRQAGLSTGLVGSGSNAYLDSHVITAGAPGATYLFTAKARDTVPSESPMISHTVVVANRAPTLSMSVNGTDVSSGQTQNTSVISGGSLSLTFSAADLDGNYQRTRLWRSADDGASWQEICNSTSASGSFLITPAAPGTWHYHARALDASGAESGTVAIIVVCQPDTTPPTAPGSLSLSGITGDSVTVAWTASTDNIGVTGYEILRDGAVAGSTSAASYTITGLAPATN
jgi:hypothetical protein